MHAACSQVYKYTVSARFNKILYQHHMCNLKPRNIVYALVDPKSGRMTSLQGLHSHTEYFRRGLLMGNAVNIVWLSTLARKRQFNVYTVTVLKIKENLYDAVPNESRRGNVW